MSGFNSQSIGPHGCRAFAASDVYRPGGTGNMIVFAAHAPLAEEAQLRERARAFDRRGGYGFSTAGG